MGKFTKTRGRFAFELIACLLLPPLAVYLSQGFGMHFAASLVMTLLVAGFPFAIVHAAYVILAMDAGRNPVM